MECRSMRSNESTDPGKGRAWTRQHRAWKNMRKQLENQHVRRAQKKDTLPKKENCEDLRAVLVRAHARPTAMCTACDTGWATE